MRQLDRLIEKQASLSKELRRLAEEAEQILAALNDSAARRPSVTPNNPDRTLDTAAAAKIAGRSYSSLYRDATRFGFGWRLPSGAWRFSEKALRLHLSNENSAPGDFGDAGGDFGDFGDAEGLPLANACAQFGEDTGD